MMASLTLRDRVRSLVRKKFFTSCWVRVLPPWTVEPARIFAARALRIERGAMP